MIATDPANWTERVVAWANTEPDITGLIEIGSRVQGGGQRIDAWSDYDYQLITKKPGKYLDGSFASAFGKVWLVSTEPAIGGVPKVNVVYEGGGTADWVIVRHWEVVVATTALRWHWTAPWWPRRLKRGVDGLGFIAGPGWKVLKGSACWEKRYKQIRPYQAQLTFAECLALCAESWALLVWAVRKLKEGQLCAAAGAAHRVNAAILRLLYEEAVLLGKTARTDGGRAETWLTPERLRMCDIAMRPEYVQLNWGIAKYAELLGSVEAAIFSANAWRLPERNELRSWFESTLDSKVLAT